MQSIVLKSHIGADGILSIQTPVETRDADVDVVLIYQPLSAALDQSNRDAFGWPEGFIKQTAGGWKGKPLVRGTQPLCDKHSTPQ